MSRSAVAQAELESQVPALAASLDGLTFTYISPVTVPQPAGSYVTVETPAGPRLGQIRQAVVEHADGPEIGTAIGGYENVRMRISFDRLTGGGTMLEPSPPFHDAGFVPAGADTIARWQESSRGRGAMLRLGEAAMAPGVLAELNAAGFGRHSFLCGQSGSGKSYAMGVILEQLLLETDIPIVVLDPNSDATRLQELSDGADPALAERWRDIAPRIRVRGLGREGDERLRLRFFELDPACSRRSSGSTRCATARSTTRCGASWKRRRRASRWSEIAAMLLDASDDPELRALRCGSATSASWSGRLGPGLRRLRPARRARRDDWRCLVVDLGSIALPAERSMVAAAVLSRAVGAPRAAPAGAARDRRGAQRLPAGSRRRADGVRDRPRRPHRRRGAQVRHLPAGRLAAAAEGARERAQPVRQPVPDADELGRRPRAAGRALLVRPPGLLARATSFGLGESLVAGRVASHPMFAKTGGRVASEGGSDVPATWAGR